MERPLKNITLYDYLVASLEKFPENMSYSFVGGDGLTYRQFGERIAQLQQIFREHGIRRGEKVAILSSSMPNWPVAYMAITASARVAVPLLPDFTAFEISNIITHSEAKGIAVYRAETHRLQQRTICRLSATTQHPLSIPPELRGHRRG